MEGSTMVKWERFVPKMGLRVLLVEDDDCTRHIIAALLRKCNYKVATVPDGLKAWEVLKARPHDIDLILTEVELPSISGYALLTLIMEQETCKNIPVIMMSKYDSVSMVYKCMLKGAADFLVKPIRINELKNLWQHVWRRQSLNRGRGQLAESTGRPKLEATAENDATSGPSSSSKACAEKGSDAQSSCGQPVLEAENAEVAPADEHPLQPELGKSALSDPNLQDTAKCSSQNLSNPKGSEDNGFYNNNETLDRDETMIPQNHVGNAIPYSEASNKVDIPADDSFREPIDLLGVLNSSCSLNDTAKKFDAPQLDFSLRRFYPGVLENNSTCEKQTLNQSSTSAFTRYVNTTVLTFTSNPTSVSHPQEDIVNSGDNLCEEDPCSISSPQDPLFPHGRKLRSSVSLPTNLAKEVEDEYQNASQRLFPLPFPVTDSANNHMSFFNQFRLDIINGGCLLENRPPYSNQPIMEDQNYPTADQCATMAHREVVGSSRCENDEIQTPCDLKLERSMRREAALQKFRLKRKERCFEKKVRYESRKKLAEQRPRVKGQFVRQVAPDPTPPCISGVNSVIR